MKVEHPPARPVGSWRCAGEHARTKFLVAFSFSRGGGFISPPPSQLSTHRRQQPTAVARGRREGGGWPSAVCWRLGVAAPACRGEARRAEPGGREQLSTLNSFYHRMARAVARGRGGGSDGVGELDGRAGVRDAEAAAGQCLLVDQGVEIGESARELHLVVVDGDRAEGGGHAGLEARTAGRRDRWTETR